MGWVFHIKEKMSDILDRAALSGQNYTGNPLFDYLSDHRVIDLVRQTGHLTIPLSRRESGYLENRLIDLVSSPRFIFRRPWFMPLKVISPVSWTARDLLEGHIYTVKIERVGSYLYYKFS